MALFRRFFYQKPPDRLLEIGERIYVFDCCFSTDLLDEDAYNEYMDGIVVQLQDNYPDASFMVFNFREGDRRSQLSDILSQYDMTVTEYPQHYGNSPLLPLEMIYHFLRCSESWLSLEGQQNVLLMHCERGGWPLLAFMLAGLLLYRKQYTVEQKTLDMFYKQAPNEILQLLSPLNSRPSQMRYLQYISGRNTGSEGPPSNTPLVIDCLILRPPPQFDAGKGCTPVVRVYGQDPLTNSSRSAKLLFSSSKKKKRIDKYYEMDSVKLDIRCHIQGDVVLECIHWCDTKEEVMFRVMFHTAFVRSNTLLLSRDEVDIMWDAKDQFPRDFKAEVHFLNADATPSARTDAESEDESDAEDASPKEFFAVEEICSNAIDGMYREKQGSLLQARTILYPPTPPPHLPLRHGTSSLPPPPPPPPHYYKVKTSPQPLFHVGARISSPPPPSPTPISGAYLPSSPSVFGTHHVLSSPCGLAPSESQVYGLPPPPPPPPPPVSSQERELKDIFERLENLLGKSDSEISLARRVQILENEVHVLKEEVRILKEKDRITSQEGKKSLDSH